MNERKGEASIVMASSAIGSLLFITLPFFVVLALILFQIWLLELHHVCVTYDKTKSIRQIVGVAAAIGFVAVLFTYTSISFTRYDPAIAT